MAQRCASRQSGALRISPALDLSPLSIKGEEKTGGNPRVNPGREQEMTKGKAKRAGERASAGVCVCVCECRVRESEHVFSDILLC